MAATRIRGTWRLTLSRYDVTGTQTALGDAVLIVKTATRAGVEGELKIGTKRVSVKGKVKPGSPAVVTLHEVADGTAVDDGIEAMLFIPPWWPNIDYNYDLISGTLVVGTASGAAKKALEGALISVSGVQPFE